MVQEQWLQLKMKFLLGYNIKMGSGRVVYLTGKIYQAWWKFFVDDSLIWKPNSQDQSGLLAKI